MGVNHLEDRAVWTVHLKGQPVQDIRNASLNDTQIQKEISELLNLQTC